MAIQNLMSLKLRFHNFQSLISESFNRSRVGNLEEGFVIFYKILGGNEIR